MNKKIPLFIVLLCSLQYFNQGISALPEQCIYYLTRESWHLSAGIIGLISWVVAIAWYLKVIFAYFVDNVPIKQYKTKYYLFGSYILLLVSYLYIILFGLNLLSLIVTGIIINICIAFSDVATDRHMVIYERKYKCAGKVQSLQWTSLGIAGLIVALGGAVVAKYFPEHINYKVAYGLIAVVPIIMLLFLKHKFTERRTIKRKKINITRNLKILKDKKLIMGLLFIACLNFCPGFGTALMIKMREGLHVDKMFLGYLGAMGTVLGIVGYILYYKWAYKFPIKRLLYFMITFTAITNLFYLYIPNKWFIVGYNLLFGAFSGIAFMTLLAFFIHLIPAGSEAFCYALVTSVNNFAARGGNFIGGVLFDKFGYSTNVVLSSVFTLLCIFLIPKLKINEILKVYNISRREL